MGTWRIFKHVFSSWHVYLIHIINFTLFPALKRDSSTQTAENVAFLNMRTWIYLPPYVHANWMDRSIGNTNHSNYPAYAPEHHTLWLTRSLTHALTHKGRDLTLCFSVNMMDREKAAGRCVDDACSHQSFNLSLCVLPAESLSFLAAPLSHSPIVCPCPGSPLVIETCLCTELSQDLLRGTGEKEEGWGGRQRGRDE